jgi:putative transposase
MCLRFVFLLITRTVSWLRLSQREETWKTAEIVLLRHQLAVLQRRQPRRPDLDWADRALLATLLAVIPKVRHYGLRLLVSGVIFGSNKISLHFRSSRLSRTRPRQ